jgi:hypothetical protein
VGVADNTKLFLMGGAAVAVWWFYLRKPAAPASPAAAAVDPNAITGANTVAGIQARVLLAAKAPAEGLGVDEWNYFVNDALGPLGKSAPDPMPLFVAASPGFDRSQKITAGQYWAVMGPALKSQLGLSGLGMYGGY